MSARSSAVAIVCVLACVASPVRAASRGYAGPVAPTAAVPSDPVPSEPPPPRLAARDRPGSSARAGQPPLVIAGVATISLGVAGYVAMVVGLALGANADTTLAALGDRSDIVRRRELVDRGQLGNRLAIGSGVAAAVALATGIALVVVGRRRADMNASARRR